ncbi:MAG: phosphoribosylanthranilate isomerase [Rhodospirillales bacterium]|nr:phosphoribosylanthranilate isomerase [Rhodospirillales bacterium]
MAKVKICGLNDPAGFDAAVAAGADWLGFVFFPASPRAILPAQAAALSARAPGPQAGGPLRAGLFVDPDAAMIAATLAEVKLDILQIYAPLARAAALAASFGLPFWHPTGVSGRDDLPRDAGSAAALLIETKAPKQATRPGGNGAMFDWRLLRGWTAPAPWLLAGGLTPDNVAEAIAVTGAAGVDVSSGVEAAPGRKDPARIRAFIAAAKAA